MKSPTSTSTLKVFVYGTLKPGERNYQRFCETARCACSARCRDCRGCDRQTKLETPAFTQGILYDLPVGYPAMTEGEKKVQGYLLVFNNLKILDTLDILEGYQTQQDSDTNEYYRLLVPVYAIDGEYLTEAWAYFMTLERVKQYQGTIITSGNWALH